MQSTARDRKTGQYLQIATPGKPVKKPSPAAEIHPETAVIADNIRMLLARYHDTVAELARFMGITDRTLYFRFERPWEFRMQELEAAAMRYDVTVRQLMSPMRFED